MTTYISQNIKKTAERIDPMGNVIDPRTKQILVENKQEEVFNVPVKTESQTVKTETPPTTSPMDIQKQIDETKERLAKLEELKKLKIAEMKKQLELLEQ